MATKPLRFGYKEDKEKYGSVIFLEDPVTTDQVVPATHGVKVRQLICEVVSLARECKHFLFILDACHSTMEDADVVLTKDSLKLIRPPGFWDGTVKEKTNAFEKSSVQLMAAAAATETAEESRSNGAFTWALKQAFRAARKLDGPHVTASDILTETDRFLRRANQSQKPALLSLAGDGDFVFSWDPTYVFESFDSIASRGLADGGEEEGGGGGGAVVEEIAPAPAEETKKVEKPAPIQPPVVEKKEDKPTGGDTLADPPSTVTTTTTTTTTTEPTKTGGEGDKKPDPVVPLTGGGSGAGGGTGGGAPSRRSTLATGGNVDVKPSFKRVSSTVTPFDPVDNKSNPSTPLVVKAGSELHTLVKKGMEGFQPLCAVITPQLTLLSAFNSSHARLRDVDYDLHATMDTVLVKFKGIWQNLIKPKPKSPNEAVFAFPVPPGTTVRQVEARVASSVEGLASAALCHLVSLTKPLAASKVTRDSFEPHSMQSGQWSIDRRGFVQVYLPSVPHKAFVQVVVESVTRGQWVESYKSSSDASSTVSGYSLSLSTLFPNSDLDSSTFKAKIRVDHAVPFKGGEVSSNSHELTDLEVETKEGDETGELAGAEGAPAPKAADDKAPKAKASFFGSLASSISNMASSAFNSVADAASSKKKDGRDLSLSFSVGGPRVQGSRPEAVHLFWSVPDELGAKGRKEGTVGAVGVSESPLAPVKAELTKEQTTTPRAGEKRASGVFVQPPVELPQGETTGVIYLLPPVSTSADGVDASIDHAPPRRIAFLVDSSSSMAPHWGATMKALSLALGTLRPEVDHFSLTLFDGKMHQWYAAQNHVECEICFQPSDGPTCSKCASDLHAFKLLTAEKQARNYPAEPARAGAPKPKQQATTFSEYNTASYFFAPVSPAAIARAISWATAKGTRTGTDMLPPVKTALQLLQHVARETLEQQRDLEKRLSAAREQVKDTSRSLVRARANESAINSALHIATLVGQLDEAKVEFDKLELTLSKFAASWAPCVMLLTDGSVNDERDVIATAMKKLPRGVRRAQFLTLGVGPFVNKVMLASLAEGTLGKSEYSFTGSEEDVGDKLKRLLSPEVRLANRATKVVLRCKSRSLFKGGVVVPHTLYPPTVQWLPITDSAARPEASSAPIVLGLMWTPPVDGKGVVTARVTGVGANGKPWKVDVELPERKKPALAPPSIAPTTINLASSTAAVSRPPPIPLELTFAEQRNQYLQQKLWTATGVRKRESLIEELVDLGERWGIPSPWAPLISAQNWVPTALLSPAPVGAAALPVLSNPALANASAVAGGAAVLPALPALPTPSALGAPLGPLAGGGSAAGLPVPVSPRAILAPLAPLSPIPGPAAAASSSASSGLLTTAAVPARPTPPAKILPAKAFLVSSSAPGYGSVSETEHGVLAPYVPHEPEVHSNDARLRRWDLTLVSRPAATLDALVVSQKMFHFDPTKPLQERYHLEVSNIVSSLSMSLEAAQSRASFTVDGQSVFASITTQLVSLSQSGRKHIPLVVTAQDAHSSQSMELVVNVVPDRNLLADKSVFLMDQNGHGLGMQAPFSQMIFEYVAVVMPLPVGTHSDDKGKTKVPPAGARLCLNPKLVVDVLSADGSVQPLIAAPAGEGHDAVKVTRYFTAEDAVMDKGVAKVVLRVRSGSGPADPKHPNVMHSQHITYTFIILFPPAPTEEELQAPAKKQAMAADRMKAQRAAAAALTAAAAAPDAHDAVASGERAEGQPSEDGAAATSPDATGPVPEISEGDEVAPGAAATAMAASAAASSSEPSLEGEALAAFQDKARRPTTSELMMLLVAGGTMTPAFQPQTTTYQVSISAERLAMMRDNKRNVPLLAVVGDVDGCLVECTKTGGARDDPLVFSTTVGSQLPGKLHATLSDALGIAADFVGIFESEIAVADFGDVAAQMDPKKSCPIITLELRVQTSAYSVPRTYTLHVSVAKPLPPSVCNVSGLQVTSYRGRTCEIHMDPPFSITQFEYTCRFYDRTQSIRPKLKIEMLLANPDGTLIEAVMANEKHTAVRLTNLDAKSKLAQTVAGASVSAGKSTAWLKDMTQTVVIQTTAKDGRSQLMYVVHIIKEEPKALVKPFSDGVYKMTKSDTARLEHVQFLQRRREAAARLPLDGLAAQHQVYNFQKLPIKNWNRARPRSPRRKREVNLSEIPSLNPQCDDLRKQLDSALHADDDKAVRQTIVDALRAELPDKIADKMSELELDRPANKKNPGVAFMWLTMPTTAAQIIKCVPQAQLLDTVLFDAINSSLKHIETLLGNGAKEHADRQEEERKKRQEEIAAAEKAAKRAAAIAAGTLSPAKHTRGVGSKGSKGSLSVPRSPAAGLRSPLKSNQPGAISTPTPSRSGRSLLTPISPNAPARVASPSRQSSTSPSPSPKSPGTLQYPMVAGTPSPTPVAEASSSSSSSAAPRIPMSLGGGQPDEDDDDDDPQGASEERPSESTFEAHICSLVNLVDPYTQKQITRFMLLAPEVQKDVDIKLHNARTKVLALVRAFSLNVTRGMVAGRYMASVTPPTHSSWKDLFQSAMSGKAIPPSEDAETAQESQAYDEFGRRPWATEVANSVRHFNEDAAAALAFAANPEGGLPDVIGGTDDEAHSNQMSEASAEPGGDTGDNNGVRTREAGDGKLSTGPKVYTKNRWYDGSVAFCAGVSYGVEVDPKDRTKVDNATHKFLTPLGSTVKDAGEILEEFKICGFTNPRDPAIITSRKVDVVPNPARGATGTIDAAAPYQKVTLSLLHEGLKKQLADVPAHGRVVFFFAGHGDITWKNKPKML